MDRYSEENRRFIVNELEKLVKAGIYPEWILRFKDKGMLPFVLSDKVILTFSTPGFISYRYRNGKERNFKDVKLNKIIDEVYVVAISMFYGDAIEFSLLDENKLAITDMMLYQNDRMVKKENYRDGYDRLNEIIYAKLNRKDHLNALVAEYKSLKDMAETVFKPRVGGQNE